MQIHELNNFGGELDSSAFLAVDNGTDTGKISCAGLMADVNNDLSELSARVNNILINQSYKIATIRTPLTFVWNPLSQDYRAGAAIDVSVGGVEITDYQVLGFFWGMASASNPEDSNGKLQFDAELSTASGTLSCSVHTTEQVYVDNSCYFWLVISYDAGPDAENAELVDIRVGADGTTYANAGDAVREQITDLKEDLTNAANEILAIPASFYSASNKCKLILQGYSGKKAFVSNKNLLPQFPAITDHGVTCVQNSDGSITLSGTSSGAATFQLSMNVMPTVGKGTYTLSARNPSAIGDNLTYINPSINGSYSGTIACRLNSADAQTTFTLGDDERIAAIRLRISSGVTFPDDYTIYPQLEEGEEKTAFVAHDGSIVDLAAESTEISCFRGYNYITAQVGVTGEVSFLMYASIEIDDLDARVTALENAPTVTKKFYGKKIVCFGDSITGNFPAPLDYPSMIAGITSATVYNAGFGGCCMSDNGQTRKDFTMCRLVDSIIAGDFSAQRDSGVSITYAGTSIDYVPDRLTMLEGIDWSDIDYITIAYGTNDWNSNYGLDNENDSLDTTTYIGAFRYSVEKLLTAYPNLKIFVVTPLWRWWDTNTGMPSEIHSDYIDSNDYAKGTGYKLWQYGDALADVAKLYHIPTFNLYWNCMMTKQNRLEYFDATDGTHPKLKGRELMAELISAQLEAIY